MITYKALKKIESLANLLDHEGYYKEAAQMDNMLQKFADSLEQAQAEVGLEIHKEREQEAEDIRASKRLHQILQGPISLNLIQEMKPLVDKVDAVTSLNDAGSFYEEMLMMALERYSGNPAKAIRDKEMLTLKRRMVELMGENIGSFVFAEG